MGAYAESTGTGADRNEQNAFGIGNGRLWIFICSWL
jgi:hypothetical protein